MFAFEALAVAYFILLGAAAPFARVSRRRAWRVVLRSLALALLIMMATQSLSAGVRVWLGHAYLVLGYWLPALLASREYALQFEAWLARSDARWKPHLLALPSLARDALEFTYLLCYPFVPAAFLVVWAYGSDADTDRFWTAVLAAGFVCYGTLPWLLSRPPRLLERGAAPADGRGIERHGPIRRLNLLVLNRLSHGLNTFPSGHVAVAVAASLMVMPIWPTAGIVTCATAAAIAAGAVVGRYHYTTDVVFGTGIAIAVAVAVRFLS